MSSRHVSVDTGASLALSAVPKEPFLSALVEAARSASALATGTALSALALRRSLALIAPGPAAAADSLNAEASLAARMIEAAMQPAWVASALPPTFVPTFTGLISHTAGALTALDDADPGAIDNMRAVLNAPSRVAALVRAQADILVASRAVAESDALATDANGTAPSPVEAELAVSTAWRVAAALDRCAAEADVAAQQLAAWEVLRGCARGACAVPRAPVDGRVVVRRAAFTLTTSAEFGLSVELPVVLVQFTDGIAALLSQPSGMARAYRMLDWYDLMSLHVISPLASNTFMLANVVHGSEKAIPPGWEEQPTKHAPGFSFKAGSLTQTTRPEAPRLKGLREFRSETIEAKAEWLAGLKHATFVDSSCSSVPYTMFGVPLDDLIAHERSFMPGLTTPLLVRKVLYTVVSSGLGEQGLLRVGGGVRTLQELRQSACCGVVNTAKEGSVVHDLTGLLKMFLRELPTALIPQDCTPKFFKATEMSGDEQLAAQVEAFASLPLSHKALLSELLAFLANVAANSHVNKMTAGNLAIVVAPNVIISTNISEQNAVNTVLTALIQNYWDFFEAPQAPLAFDTAPTDFVSFRRKLLGHNRSIRTMSLTSDKHGMFSIDTDGEVHLWDTIRCEHIDSFPTEFKNPSAVCSIGSLFWIATLNGLFVFDPPTKYIVSKIQKVVALSITYLPKRGEVWCGSEGNVLVFKASTCTSLATLNPGGNPVFFATCAASTDCVWTGAFQKGATEQFTYVWDYESDNKYKMVTKIPMHPKKITSLARVGEQVWSTSDDNTIVAWDARTYTRLCTMERHTGSVLGLAVLPDQVWSCSWDMTIKIWDSTSFRCVGEIRGYHTDTVSTLTSCVDSASGLFNVWSASYDKALCVWYVRPIPALEPKLSEIGLQSSRTFIQRIVRKDLPSITPGDPLTPRDHVQITYTSRSISGPIKLQGNTSAAEAPKQVAPLPQRHGRESSELSKMLKNALAISTSSTAPATSAAAAAGAGAVVPRLTDSPKLSRSEATLAPPPSQSSTSPATSPREKPALPPPRSTTSSGLLTTKPAQTAALPPKESSLPTPKEGLSSPPLESPGPAASQSPPAEVPVSSVSASRMFFAGRGRGVPPSTRPPGSPGSTRANSMVTPRGRDWKPAVPKTDGSFTAQQ